MPSACDRSESKSIYTCLFVKRAHTHTHTAGRRTGGGSWKCGVHKCQRSVPYYVKRPLMMCRALQFFSPPAGAVPVVVGAAVPCAVQGKGDESPVLFPQLAWMINWLGTVPARRITCSLLSLSLVDPPINTTVPPTFPLN